MNPRVWLTLIGSAIVLIAIGLRIAFPSPPTFCGVTAAAEEVQSQIDETRFSTIMVEDGAMSIQALFADNVSVECIPEGVQLTFSWNARTSSDPTMIFLTPNDQIVVLER